jgi:hypothetical protein
MDDRTRILEMLREGKISVDEADRLLRALEAEPNRPASSRGRLLRLRISGHRGERINVAVPLALADMLLRFLPKNARMLVHGQEVDIGQVVEHVRDSYAHGTIVDIHDPRGDRIEVSVE